MFQAKSGTGLGIPDDQDKLLSEALAQVDKNSFEMKTCLVTELFNYTINWDFFYYLHEY